MVGIFRRICREARVDHKLSPLSHLTRSAPAAIPLAGVELRGRALPAGRFQAGQSVLIYGGSGGVGDLAIQSAKARPARVLITVSTDKLEFARLLGAETRIDYKTPSKDLVFDLIDGETRKLSWRLLKRTLVSGRAFGSPTMFGLAPGFADTELGVLMEPEVCLMGDRKFTREFKLEAVRLIKRAGRLVCAGLARPLVWMQFAIAQLGEGVCDYRQDAFPGQGQMKPEQLEIARLKREVIKLKAEQTS